MTIHESGNQCSSPAVNDSNSSPVTLPLRRGADPMDSPITNLYGHFGLRGRAGSIPELNVVNKEVQFSTSPSLHSFPSFEYSSSRYSVYLLSAVMRERARESWNRLRHS